MAIFSRGGISILLCTLFAHNGARLTPDFIHPCIEDDNDCILNSARQAVPEFVKGMPALGVPPMDPFVIEKLSIPLNGLKISFYHGKVTGFRKCIIDKIKSVMKKHTFSMEFHCNITLKGGYDAVGRILVFPINGEGDAKIKLTNLRAKFDLETKILTDEQGVTHFAVKDYKYDFDYGDKVTFNLTNLFKESQELSNTVLIFLNENWRQVATEFGKPIVDYATELALRTIEKFFLAVPYDELIEGPVHVYE